MLRAALYEELIKQNLGLIICPKEEMKEKLQEFGRKLNLNEDTLIIQVCEDEYKMYYSEKNNEIEKASIQIDLALRFRLELDIFELEQAMLRVDEAVLNYPFYVITDKYCLVRYMDLSDDFFILDVYIGVEEKEKIVLM